MKTLAGTRDLGFARMREKSGLGFVLYRSGGVELGKEVEKGVQNPSLAQTRLTVPVPISVVPVPNGHCLFLRGWYRYR